MGWLGGCSALRSDFLLADTLTWFAVTAGLTTVEVLELVITWFGKGGEEKSIGLFPSSSSAFLYRTPEKYPKVPGYTGYRGIKGREERGFRSRHGKGGQ